MEEKECPYCGAPIKSKMIEVDSTNIEEYEVCTECNFGYPV